MLALLYGLVHHRVDEVENKQTLPYPRSSLQHGLIAGVITDPAAREDRKRWMMLASRAKPPATANDFMETDREDDVKRLKFLTYPKQEDLILQSKLTLCSCACCILSKQDDFKSHKSGLEEIYENHNKMHGTSHQCKFLPKFHPKLNPIERVWSRLKSGT